MNPIVGDISQARPEDHAAIVSICRGHRALSAFGHIMFSGPAAYERGWIRVFRIGSVIVGFTCVRHKVREPETSLYYIGVQDGMRGHRIGEQLIEDVKRQSPHRRMTLSVLADNAGARKFYARLGFSEAGPALGGKGVKLKLEW